MTDKNRIGYPGIVSGRDLTTNAPIEIGADVDSQSLYVANWVYDPDTLLWKRAVQPTNASGIPTVVIGDGTNDVGINDDGQMHIVAEGHLCTTNSTTTPLVADEVYTGTAINILAYNGISVFVTSDQASATDGLEIQYSADGSTNWRCAEVYTVLAGAEKWFSPPAFGVYFRVVYTNGIVDQTSFELTTVLRKVPFKWSSHNIDKAITDQDDAILTKAVITGKKVDGDYDNVNLTNGANMKVSLEELESGISSNSNSQLNVTQFDSSGNEIASQLNTAFTDNLDGTVGLITSSILYGRIDDDTLKPIKVDGSTQDIQIVEHEHAEIHSGDHYFIEDVVDIAINTVFDVQWTTADSTKREHFTFLLNCESETEWMIYEGATITTPGTTLTPFNNDRNSGNTSLATIASISNTSLANANADTPVAGAVEIAHGIVGAGRDGGIIGRDREIILKQDSIYCMRAIANAAGYVNFLMEWYEHMPKN